MSRPLCNRRVLLTGGSRGIGRSIARHLLQAGAELALIGRDVEALRRVHDGCVVEADLMCPEGATRWVERCVAGLGGVDAVVHCAGVANYESLLDVTDGALDRQMKVNFLSPLALSRAAGRVMARENGGDLVFVASTLGLRPVPATAVYAASKAALISLSRSCAVELGPLGIRANAVAPGVIDTEMIRAPRPGEDAGVNLESLANLHLLKRLGTTDEVAEAVCHLLTTDFVNGSVLTIDGGLSIG